MSERKEPGQLAYEADIDAAGYHHPLSFSELADHIKESYVRVEAAIYEDAAKCAEDFMRGQLTTGADVAESIRARSILSKHKTETD